MIFEITLQFFVTIDNMHHSTFFSALFLSLSLLIPYHSSRCEVFYLVPAFSATRAYTYMIIIANFQTSLRLFITSLRKMLQTTSHEPLNNGLNVTGDDDFHTADHYYGLGKKLREVSYGSEPTDTRLVISYRKEKN